MQPSPTTENRKLVVTAILLAMFMSAMEATVVATAMPTVVSELSGLELYGWVGSIYMLATTVTIPLWGKLADLYGRKPVMLAGLVVFLVGSIASGMATDMRSLILFRAIQGIGAGALQPIALTIVGDIFTIEERAKMQGVFGAVWGVAGMAGPLLGGLIVKALSWRWVFYVNVPFGIFSGILLLVMYFKENIRRTGIGSRRSTLQGAILLALCVLSILGASSGRDVALLAPVCARHALRLFLWIQTRAKEPILPLRLFQQSGRCGGERRRRAPRRGHDVQRHVHPAVRPSGARRVANGRWHLRRAHAGGLAHRERAQRQAARAARVSSRSFGRVSWR